MTPSLSASQHPLVNVIVRGHCRTWSRLLLNEQCCILRLEIGYVTLQPKSALELLLKGFLYLAINPSRLRGMYKLT